MPGAMCRLDRDSQVMSDGNVNGLAIDGQVRFVATIDEREHARGNDELKRQRTLWMWLPPLNA